MRGQSRKRRWSGNLRFEALCFLGMLALGACGGEDPRLGPDPIPDDPIPDAPPPVTALPLETPTETAVVFGETTALTFEASVAGEYAILLEGTSFAAVDVSVLDGASDAVLGSCLADDEACIVDLPAGSHRIELTQVDSPWTLHPVITLIPVVNEGTAASPVHLDLSVETFLTVGTGGRSYFTFDATLTGAYFVDEMELVIRAFHERGWELRWYADADFASEPVGLCYGESSGGCYAYPLEVGVYGLRIDHIEGDPVLLRGSVVKGLGEGTPNSPVPLALGGAAHAGGVDHNTKSYYGFTTSAHAGGYRLTFAGLPEGQNVAVDVYEASDLTTIVDGCSGAHVVCSVTLDPSTSYIAIVTRLGGAVYSIAASEGVSEGTEAQPVTLAPGAPHDGAVDPGGISYYEFTPSESGIHVLTTTSSSAVSSDYYVRFVDPDFPYEDADKCEMIPCELGYLVAGLTYAVRIYRAAETEDHYALTIAHGPGEGVYDDPHPLVVGERHAASLHPIRASWYEFTADAVGGDYAIVFSGNVPLTLEDATGTSYFIDCDGVGSSPCVVEGLAPNERVFFSVRSSVEGAGESLWIEALSLRPGTPCLGGATPCVDFESGTTPAGVTEPATSTSPWSVATAAASTGTYGFASGTGAASCFELASPATSAAMLFSAHVLEADFLDELTVAVDGVTKAWINASAQYHRYVVGLDPATSHTVRFCFASGGGGGQRHGWVDDIEFR